MKAVPGGANIKPGVAGNYDVYYRPDCEVIIVNPAGADLNYWGVVGTITGWGSDSKVCPGAWSEYASGSSSSTDVIQYRISAYRL